MTRKEKKLDTNEDPDAIVEFLFVDKDFNQEKAEANNEGTFYESVDLYFTGENKNDDLLTLRKLLPIQVNSRAEELIYFEGRAIDLSTYKYGVIDENKTITEFNAVDDAFFQALKKTLKFIIVGKEFALEKFKDHKIFIDFFEFVYSLFDEEKILEHYVEPDATMEYLFVEKAENQIKSINDDQGYQMGFMSIFFTGKFANNNLASFKTQLLDELNYSVKEYNYFKSEKVDLNEYKFFLVDNNKNTTEFAVMDEGFYEVLIASLRNLVIVGKNFDLEKFKHHRIFNDWFDEYSNRF
ncbi:MAG: hypothetical protein HWN66_17165 [Candidatus Helarchaeota archaeon]|nr:hypothetical protein [Candidatus Helarchaeota archaeon]